MRRYPVVIVLILTFFLSLFLLVEWLKVPLLTDPTPWLAQGGGLMALIGVGLLIADVALPVPSSLVMVAHGALFGVVLGTFLSMVGSVGAAMVGFAVGRHGGPLLSRLVPDNERERADCFLRRWGALAIVVTRPMPLLAETTAILAGASPLGWGRATLAAFIGSLPGAILYAMTGAFAARLANGVLVFGLVLIVASGFWLIGRWSESHRAIWHGEPS